MKAIPSSSTGMEQSEGSPQDLQSLTAHFVTSAKGRAGISIDEDSPPDCSDLSEAESNIESAISLLAFLEENVSGSFRLAEIARLPGNTLLTLHRELYELFFFSGNRRCKNIPC